MTTPGPERPRREPEAEHDEPRVIRDKRRVDPVTGAVRDPAPAGPNPPGGREGSEAENRPTSPHDHGEGEEVAALRTQIAERTADLQRLQAEYVNYRRRVERDREAVRDQATATLLLELLSVLDDIGRARDHGELEGPFKAVAESVESVVTKLGLERYGEPGDPFDPTVHEALMHAYAEDVTQPTCVQILQPGYRLGER
ncbi:MAG: nucleotide exchange factor GrpE, partial [Actinomycetes bacterium]